MSRVVSIYLRPSSRTPAKSVEQASCVVGQGLLGDHAHKGKREVTLMSREAWEAACAELGYELEPGTRRANLLVEGIDLAESRGRTIRVGEALLLIHGETKPCGLMDDARLGLKDALFPEWRGGVFAQVLEGGEIAVGDLVGWVEAAAATAERGPS